MEHLRWRVRLVVLALCNFSLAGCTSSGPDPAASGATDADVLPDQTAGQSPKDSSSDVSQDVPTPDFDGGLDADVQSKASDGPSVDEGSTPTDDGGCTDIADVAVDDVRITDARVDVAYGDGGTGQCLPSSLPLVCGALCGNGTRDTCQDGGPAGPPDGGIASVTEQCDGLDLGGASCTSLGFVGGTLGCDNRCNFDVSQCQTYAPTSRPDGGPDAGALGPAVGGVGLAANATELGFAWVEHDSACKGVRFARYDGNLTPLAESGCLGSCDTRTVAVAATSNGWMLAMGTDHGIDVLPVDGQGNATGAAQTIVGGTPATETDAGSGVVIFTAASLYVPTLTPRAVGSTVSGGPLLTWVDSSGQLLAAILGNDGSLEQPTVRLLKAFLENDEAGRHGAVFAGDRFVVAERESAPYDGVAVRSVWLDGSVGVERHPFPCWHGEHPRLAWTGTEVRMTLFRFDSGSQGIYLARLDRDGTLLAPAQRIPLDNGFLTAPVAAMGTETVLLVDVDLSSSGPPSGYYSARVGSSGAIMTAQITPASVGNLGAETYLFPDLVALGTKAFGAGLSLLQGSPALYWGSTFHENEYRPLLMQIN